MGAIPDEARIGEGIRLARKNAGLTQEDLANLVGLSERTVRHIEKGSPAPSIGAVIAVANALGLTVRVTP